MKIAVATPKDESRWDSYVAAHPNACLYHRFGWRRVIEKTYGHPAFYLMAIESSPNASFRIRGVLPLIVMKNRIFGNHLVSIPFFDFGGVLADTVAVEKALLAEALAIGRRNRLEVMELRHIRPLESVGAGTTENSPLIRRHKVRMILRLRHSPDAIMKGFKSKLRSQIRRPMKAGLTARVGGPELLDDFYRVFAENMRDLGSPVHSKAMIANTLAVFPEESRIVAVYDGSNPLAASFVVSHGHTVENPWASSLRQYSRQSPNMLLYWTMLRHACETGHAWFDFGRSSPDEGTYRFKAQWGSEAVPLHWYYFPMNHPVSDASRDDPARYNAAISVWKRLPLPLANWLGPQIRRHIGL